MAGSTHALPTAEAGTAVQARSRHFSPGREAWRRFRRHRLAVLSSVILMAMVLAILLGPFLWNVPINEIDFTARLKSPSWQHPLGTDDLGQDLLARMHLWRAHFAGRGPCRHVRRHRRRHHRRRHCRHVARRRRHRPDVAHRPVSVAAAAAAAAARDVSLPRFPQGRVRARGRRLHPHRHRHRRLALDAGGAARARAVPVAAREGVRRGGARAGRQQDASGGAPHPAQLRWAR